MFNKKKYNNPVEARMASQKKEKNKINVPHSPVVEEDDGQPIETFTFNEALNKMIEGKKVSRIEWGADTKVFGFLSGKQGERVLKIFGGYAHDGKVHDWTIVEQDLVANDWVVVG